MFKARIIPVPEAGLFPLDETDVGMVGLLDKSSDGSWNIHLPGDKVVSIDDVWFDLLDENWEKSLAEVDRALAADVQRSATDTEELFDYRVKKLILYRARKYGVDAMQLYMWSDRDTISTIDFSVVPDLGSVNLTGILNRLIKDNNPKKYALAFSAVTTLDESVAPYQCLAVKSRGDSGVVYTTFRFEDNNLVDISETLPNRGQAHAVYGVDVNVKW